MCVRPASPFPTPTPACIPFCPNSLQVLEHVAAVLGKDSAEVKAANFLPEVATTNTNSSCSSSSDDGVCIPAAENGVVRTVLGRVLAAEGYTLPRLWRELLASSGYAARVAAVREHNKQHAWSKRGIVVTPVR
jgi:xanthine dehydrogenase molybdopterin-binding subunit B